MDFKCQLCLYSSDSINFLHVHSVNAHPKEFFTCPWCTIPFATLRLLQSHTKICPALDKDDLHEGEINTVLVNDDKCLVCEGRFQSNAAAIKHYKEQHLNFSYICDVCEMYFQHNSSLDVHRATNHPKKGIQSPKMGVQSPKMGVQSPKMVTRTTSTTNPNNKRTAPIAFAHETATTASLAKRRKTRISTAPSTVKKTFMRWFHDRKYCYECEIDFACTQEIVKHFKIVHSTDVFTCELCERGYLMKSSVAQHQREGYSGKQCPGKNGKQNATKPQSEADGELLEPVPRAATPTQSKTVDKSPGSPKQAIATCTMFSCYLCEFETTSRELVNSHIVGQHSEIILGKVKLECIDNGYVSSTTVQGIKADPDTANRGIFWTGFDGIIDLTSDD